MLYALKVAAIIKATDLVMDSEFVVLDDGMNPDRPTDVLAHTRFLNTVEVLREGFENERYAIRLVPVKVYRTDLIYPLINDPKQHWYEDKAKSLDTILKKFAKKLNIEVRDPSELSDLQKLWMKGVK